MKYGVLLLDESEINFISNKAVADHRLIDRPLLQHMLEEWSKSSVDQVFVYIKNADKYKHYENDKIAVKELVEYKKLSLDNMSVCLQVDGYYPLLNQKELDHLLDCSNAVQSSHEDFVITYEQEEIQHKYSLNDVIKKDSLLKIESRKDIILANEILTDKIIQYWTSNGATIMNGNIIGKDVVLGTDVYIHQGNQIIGKSQLGDEVEIIGQSFLQNVHLENKVTVKNSTLTDSKVGEGSVVGPYAHLRNQTIIGKSCRIGNYVELKNTHFDDYSAVSHLSYLGDARIGKHVNIGCHVVTVNYDGKNKHQTIIKDKTFIGSASNLIAPVSIGENVVVAAGSTITEDIADGEMAFARSRQINKPELGKKYLERDK